jgi:hypothetical protein
MSVADPFIGYHTTASVGGGVHVKAPVLVLKVAPGGGLSML